MKVDSAPIGTRNFRAAQVLVKRTSQNQLPASSFRIHYRSSDHNAVYQEIFAGVLGVSHRRDAVSLVICAMKGQDLRRMAAGRRRHNAAMRAGARGPVLTGAGDILRRHPGIVICTLGQRQLAVGRGRGGHRCRGRSQLVPLPRLPRAAPAPGRTSACVALWPLSALLAGFRCCPSASTSSAMLVTSLVIAAVIPVTAGGAAPGLGP